MKIILPSYVSAEVFQDAFNKAFERDESGASIYDVLTEGDSNILCVNLLNLYDYDEDFKSLLESVDLKFHFYDKDDVDYKDIVVGDKIVISVNDNEKSGDAYAYITDMLKTMVQKFGGYEIQDDKQIYHPITDILGSEYKLEAHTNIVKSQMTHILESIALNENVKEKIIQASLRALNEEYSNVELSKSSLNL